MTAIDHSAAAEILLRDALSDYDSSGFGPTEHSAIHGDIATETAADGSYVVSYWSPDSTSGEPSQFFTATIAVTLTPIAPKGKDPL